MKSAPVLLHYKVQSKNVKFLFVDENHVANPNPNPFTWWNLPGWNIPIYTQARTNGTVGTSCQPVLTGKSPAFNTLIATSELLRRVLSRISTLYNSGGKNSGRSQIRPTKPFHPTRQVFNVITKNLSILFLFYFIHLS